MRSQNSQESQPTRSRRETVITVLVWLALCIATPVVLGLATGAALGGYLQPWQSVLVVSFWLPLMLCTYAAGQYLIKVGPADTK